MHRTAEPTARQPENFEEIKLVLALAWQRGRWDGSDGGPGGYGEVLAAMAAAARYEIGSPQECSRRLVEDMRSRLPLLDPETEDLDCMEKLFDDCGHDIDLARRRCSGLVLKAMGFVDGGL